MSLEEEFTQALENTIEAAKTKKYYLTYFLQMLGKYGGLGTAQRLLANKETQTGLLKLYELELLGESMEAVVLHRDVNIIVAPSYYDVIPAERVDRRQYRTPRGDWPG